MIYNEVYKDLFTVDEDFHLAHCISSDAKMGAGIAVEFKERFNLQHMSEWARKNPLLVGSCIKNGRVLNLVTKRRYYDKPSYKSFRVAIEDMKRVVLENDIKKIAMPQIGSGLDKLNWYKCRDIIMNVFMDVDIQILVCKKPDFKMS